jgi:hypothetical protein
LTFPAVVLLGTVFSPLLGLEPGAFWFLGFFPPVSFCAVCIVLFLALPIVLSEDGDDDEEEKYVKRRLLMGCVAAQVANLGQKKTGQFFIINTTTYSSSYNVQQCK